MNSNRNRGNALAITAHNADLLAGVKWAGLQRGGLPVAWV